MNISDKKFVIIKPPALFFQLIAIVQREKKHWKNFQLWTHNASYVTFQRWINTETKKSNSWQYSAHHKSWYWSKLVTCLDGGALLHKVQWHTSVTFGDVCKLYVDHITLKHGTSTTEFDGYSDTTSTKDYEHARSINSRGCVDAPCNVSTKVNITQDVFLPNSTNKSCFIDLLSS